MQFVQMGSVGMKKKVIFLEEGSPEKMSYVSAMVVVELIDGGSREKLSPDYIHGVVSQIYPSERQIQYRGPVFGFTFDYFRGFSFF